MSVIDVEVVVELDAKEEEEEEFLVASLRIFPMPPRLDEIAVIGQQSERKKIENLGIWGGN